MNTAAGAKVMMLGDSRDANADPLGGPQDSALAEFERVYRANAGAVTAYFARRCAEPQTVADLTSETFVRAAVGFGGFDPRRGSRRAWVFGIAANVYAGHCAHAANGRDAVARLAGHRALEVDEIDEVGYTLRTAALMTGPEYHFDETNPADYRLFGIRYLILPSSYLPTVPARPVMRAGPYSLWTIPANGYVHVGTIVGELVADRTDLGARSIPLLRSRLAQADDYLRVAFGHERAAPRAPPPSSSASPPGTVFSQADELDRGELTATVRMRRGGVVVLSVSFDPGWTVTIDGRPVNTFMIAPALVGTDVPPGTHLIAFRYRGYGGYLGLFVLCGLALAAVVAVTAAGRRRGRAGIGITDAAAGSAGR